MHREVHHLGTSVSEVVAPLADVEQSAPSDDIGRLSPQERRWARIGVLVAVVAFCLLATCMQPWNLFSQGPFSTNFYDAQARSLTHGHLDVPASVAGIEGFVIDGRTQIYFGIGPAILRLPFSGLSDVFDGRLSLMSELLAIAVLGMAAARLLKRARTLVRGAPAGSSWWFGAAAAIVTLGTPLLFLSSRPLVYHEAELWGAAAGLAGLDLVLRWWREPTRRHLIEAVAVAAFAISCRPSSGASPAIALGLFGLVLAWRREWRRSLITIASALVPLAAFALVNWLRFRSFTDVPFPKQVFSQFDTSRQETLARNDGSLFGAAFVPTTMMRYLSPFAIRFDRLFPFVTWPSPARVIGDVRFDTIDRSGSIVTGAPIIFLFALVGSWWTILRDRTRQWSVLVLAALVSTTSTFTFAYIAHRYLADLVPVIVVLAAPAVWVVARWMAERTRTTRQVVAGAIVVLFALGAWNQLGLAISTRAFSIVPTESAARAFARLQYDIDDSLFGGAPPAVHRFTGDELPLGVPAGTIEIVGDCAAVYRFDGYGWGSLERRNGAGRAFELHGSIPAGRSTTILTGDGGWTLSAFGGADDRVTFVHRAGDGTVLESVPMELGGDVTLEVVADPLPRNEVVVVANGKKVLDLAYVETLGATPDRSWTSVDGEAPFCDSLVRRLPTN